MDANVGQYEFTIVVLIRDLNTSESLCRGHMAIQANRSMGVVRYYYYGRIRSLFFVVEVLSRW